MESLLNVIRKSHDPHPVEDLISRLDSLIVSTSRRRNVNLKDVFQTLDSLYDRYINCKKASGSRTHQDVYKLLASYRHAWVDVFGSKSRYRFSQVEKLLAEVEAWQTGLRQIG